MFLFWNMAIFQNEQNIPTVLESGVKLGKLKTWAFWNKKVQYLIIVPMMQFSFSHNFQSVTLTKNKLQYKINQNVTRIIFMSMKMDN